MNVENARDELFKMLEDEIGEASNVGELTKRVRLISQFVDETIEDDPREIFEDLKLYMAANA